MDMATSFIIVRVEGDERTVGLFEIDGGGMTTLQRIEELIELDMPPVAFNTELLIAVLRTPAPWTPSTTRAYEPATSTSTPSAPSPELDVDPVISPASQESSSQNEASIDEFDSPPASPEPTLPLSLSVDLTMEEKEEDLEEEDVQSTN